MNTTSAGGRKPSQLFFLSSNMWLFVLVVVGVYSGEVRYANAELDDFWGKLNTQTQLVGDLKFRDLLIIRDEAVLAGFSKDLLRVDDGYPPYKPPFMKIYLNAEKTRYMSSVTKYASVKGWHLYDDYEGKWRLSGFKQEDFTQEQRAFLCWSWKWIMNLNAFWGEKPCYQFDVDESIFDYQTIEDYTLYFKTNTTSSRRYAFPCQ